MARCAAQKHPTQENMARLKELVGRDAFANFQQYAAQVQPMHAACKT